ncbi:MAG: cyclic nucleotide-binding domain-containing protein [Sinimarinibacterium sp.]|jgi:CRP-like cAMP-binding protein
MNDAAIDPSWYGELRASPIVQDLADDVLSTIARRGKTLELKRADPLLVQDVRGGLGLFILLFGTIAIYRRVDDDVDGERLSVLQPGDCVGEYSLIDGQPLSATARALEPVRLFFLPNAQFRALTEQDPRAGCILYRNLARHLVRRLRLQ